MLHVDDDDHDFRPMFSDYRNEVVVFSKDFHFDLIDADANLSLISNYELHRRIVRPTVSSKVSHRHIEIFNQSIDLPLN